MRDVRNAHAPDRNARLVHPVSVRRVRTHRFSNGLQMPMRAFVRSCVHHPSCASVSPESVECPCTARARPSPSAPLKRADVFLTQFQSKQMRDTVRCITLQPPPADRAHVRTCARWHAKGCIKCACSSNAHTCRVSARARAPKCRCSCLRGSHSKQQRNERVPTK